MRGDIFRTIHSQLKETIRPIVKEVLTEAGNKQIAKFKDKNTGVVGKITYTEEDGGGVEKATIEIDGAKVMLDSSSERVSGDVWEFMSGFMMSILNGGGMS